MIGFIMINTYRNINITIPSTLNTVIAVSAMASACFLLWLVSHTQSTFVMILGILAFGYVGNTIFSLLHEAVHSNFHHDRKMNYWVGNFLAAFFPTGFSFQRRCHLNHHRNNRTEYELFETYQDGDIKALRTLMLYFILMGPFWIFPPLGSLWLMINPRAMINSNFSGKGNPRLGRIGGASMLRSFQNISNTEYTQMRLEVLFSLSLQLGLFFLLGLTLKGWLLCYVSFAVLWSSLQYADHAYSAVDIRNGAWNLKVNPVTKAFFLNYHDHLAHHQHPHVPWIHLPKFIDPAVERPNFWAIYLRMWKGPIKMDRQVNPTLDPELEDLINKQNFQTEAVS